MDFLNKRDTLGYLARLFEPGDWINLQLIHQTETWTDEHGAKHANVDNNFARLEDLLKPETSERIADLQDKGWNAYVGMNAFTPGLQRRRKKDVKNVRSVYVEFDENGEAGLDAIDKDAAESLVPAPDFILQSSPGKFYVIWRVKDFTVERTGSTELGSSKTIRVRPGFGGRGSCAASARHSQLETEVQPNAHRRDY